MPLDIAAIKLISDLVLAISSSYSKIKKSPKQRLGRSLVTLFDNLDKVESKILDLLENLRTFESEQQIGMRVHHIHMCGQLFDDLGHLSDNLIKFINSNEDFKIVLDVYGSNSENPLRELKKFENFGMLAQEDEWFIGVKFNFEELKNQLQAVRSPDPKHFPPSDFTHGVIIEMEMLQLNIHMARSELVEFAKKNLTIEDLFNK